MFQNNLGGINVDSPGKQYRSKLNPEKELAHESHLIHNQMQQIKSKIEIDDQF